MKLHGEKLISPIFTVESFGKSMWVIELLPWGVTKENEGNVSLYLKKKSDDSFPSETRLGFNINLYGIDKKNLKSRSYSDKQFVNESRWGWSRFISTTEVIDKLKILNHDILIVRCEMLCSCNPITPERKAFTEVGVDRCSVLWNVKIPDKPSEIIRYEFVLSKKSLYEISFCIPEDDTKICILSKEESVLPRDVNCKLSLISLKGDEITSTKASHLFELKNKDEPWEFPSLTSKTFLESNRTVLIEDCGISLLCEFAASSGKFAEVGSESGDEYFSDVDMHSALQEEFKNMFFNHMHSDIKLKIEGEIIQVHKCVLAARSPVFARMFDQDMTESRTGVVEILDLEVNVLKLLLEFIYTGNVDIMDFKTAKKLLLIADKYQVATLVDKCAYFLKSVMSIRNCCEILGVADMISHARLRTAAVNFISTNSTTIFKSTEWSKLLANNAKLSEDVFLNIVDKFNIVPKNNVV